MLVIFFYWLVLFFSLSLLFSVDVGAELAEFSAVESGCRLLSVALLLSTSLFLCDSLGFSEKGKLSNANDPNATKPTNSRA